jgi:hemerythrin
MRLEWQAKLETGVEQIDNQHRELYRLVNLVLDPGEETKVEDTLKFLENYVVRHFTDEEALQAASQFPDLPEHKEIHAGFIRTFIDLKTQWALAESDKEREIAVRSLNGTVLDWLGNHIMIHDRHFADWYKSFMRR